MNALGIGCAFPRHAEWSFVVPVHTRLLKAPGAQYVACSRMAMASMRGQHVRLFASRWEGMANG